MKVQVVRVQLRVLRRDVVPPIATAWLSGPEIFQRSGEKDTNCSKEFDDFPQPAHFTV